MNDGELKKFIDLSRAIGRRSDFIQGTGGNVSVKINDKMLIKASGWRLEDISENSGLVVVNVNNGDVENSQGLRPSMEMGFHMFLDKYVVHTHSVYTNIVACAADGRKIFGDISREFGVAAAWVDYQSPGSHLASAVKKAVEEFKSQYGIMPEAILMKNHGLIVSSDNLENVFNLHNEIQELVKQYLDLKRVFPKDVADYLKRFVKNNSDFIEVFSRNILFPDQVVFCGNTGEKVLINKKTNNIVYKTNKKEARAIEENLIAWVYIVDCAKDCGLTLNFLSLENIDYIKNMESEKYRQQLLKK